MNANQMINMVVRLVMRRVLRTGVNAGIDAVGKRISKGKPTEDTPANHDTAKVAQRARQAMRVTNKIGRL